MRSDQSHRKDGVRVKQLFTNLIHFRLAFNVQLYYSQQVHDDLQIRSLGDALSRHCTVSDYHGRTTHQGERTGANVQNQQI